MSLSTLEQAAMELCGSNTLPQSVAIADLGCSSGPNSLVAVTNITSIIYKRCCQLGRSPPEFSVFLNDLVGNDFNTIFKALPAFRDKMEQEFGPLARVTLVVFRALFMAGSSHQEACILYIPLLVFTGRLRYRSEEIAPDGRMVLPFRGRRTQDPSTDESCHLCMGLLVTSIPRISPRGLIEKGKLDNDNTSYYEPYTEDVRREIEKEGSFIVDRLETVQLPWDGVNGGKSYDRAKTAQLMGKAIRAVNESMFRSHFGGEILDSLFQKFSRIMAADNKEVEHVNVVVSVIRNA